LICSFSCRASECKRQPVAQSRDKGLGAASGAV
jgi:hypothetical protein